MDSLSSFWVAQKGVFDSQEVDSSVLVQPQDPGQMRFNFYFCKLVFFLDLSLSVVKNPRGGKFSCKLAYSLFSAIPVAAGKEEHYDECSHPLFILKISEFPSGFL